MTHNACATQAMLSILLNSEGAVEGDEAGETGGRERGTTADGATAAEPPPSSRLVLGKTLTDLRTFASSLPPDVRGEVIGSSEEIRSAHNSYARRDAFLTDPEDRKRKARNGEEEEDVFHFVAYVPHSNGGVGGKGGDEMEAAAVYELDGLRAGPIHRGSYARTVMMSSSGGDGDGEGGEDNEPNADDVMSWLTVARTAVQERIEKYAAEEIKFNLMAVVRDKRIGLRRKLANLDEMGAEAGGAGDALVDEMAHVRSELVAEGKKREGWNEENQRRRHNYLPFCVELLRSLAKSGKFPDLVKKANDRTMELRRRAIEKRMAAKAKGL